VASNNPADKSTKGGAKHNEAGLQHYAAWEIDEAVGSFQEAIAADPENPEYLLNLARAYVRGGNYPDSMRALGAYLHCEKDENVAERYERLFSSALDEVEARLIEGMRKLDLPIQQIGKAIQMWLEYRITIGRRPLRVPKPELWAAGLTNAICKINFVDIDRQVVAQEFGVSDRAVREKYRELLETLDLMPADYRYFTGEENPLDKLIEAAQLLEEIYQDFQD
jgi:tetratricopeptide (TPR) repeat protein